MARTDVHSPKSFIVEDYSTVDYFGVMKMGNYDRGDGEPDFIEEPYGEEAMRAYEHQADEAAGNPHPDINQCDLCGTWFKNGAVLEHKPTGRLISVGGICMTDIAGLSHLSKREKLHRAKASKRRRERAAKMRNMLALYPGINAALKTDHYISRDLRVKVLQWGDLSPKQAELAFKLQSDVANREPELDPRPVPTEDKRITVEGEILSTKFVEGYYGDVEKMLVQVRVDGGAFKLWGSVPQAINDACWTERERRREEARAKYDVDSLDDEEARLAIADIEQAGAPIAMRGLKIQFTARLEQSDKDEAFGFFKRPTKVSVLSWGE